MLHYNVYNQNDKLMESDIISKDMNVKYGYNMKNKTKNNPIMSNASKYKGWYSKGIPAMVCKTYKEIRLK